MREFARHVLTLVLLTGFACAPAGCKAVGNWFSPAEEVELGGVSAGSADLRTRVSDAELTDPDARRGLEVRMLVVDDTNYDAPRMLNAFPVDQASLIDVRTQGEWARWGFRVVEVPLAQLEDSLAQLRPVRPVSVQWLGEFGAWRPLVRAGASSQTRVRVGDSTRTIEPGRPCLIARSWIEPMLTENDARSVLRLDLGIQIQAERSSTFALLPDQRARVLDDSGQVIDELLSSITLRGDHALVIVGEAPGTDWDALPQPVASASIPFRADENQIGPDAEPSKDETEGDDSRGMPEPETSESRPFTRPIPSNIPSEPRVPTTRSLGELMLVTRGSRIMRANESRSIPRRVVVVLVPSVQGPYRMLTGTKPVASGGDS